MMLPTIHTNGTSARMLAEGYSEARVAVQAAMAKMQEIEFNARDYYVQGPDAWRIALAERTALFEKLREVSDALYKHEEHCCDFMK